MTDRFNTFFGWLLFSGIVALGLSSISSHYFRADKHNRPEKMGYPIAGVQEEGAGQGPSLNTLLATADPAAGEKVFAKCMSCHTATQGGPNGIGPNLYGVVGDEMGHGRGGFAFSSDLAAKTDKWTFENLNAWLTSPRAFAAGTKMSFAGLSDPKDRANVIAYLNSMGSNLPMPKADAAPAAGKDDKAAAGKDDKAAAGAPAAADAAKQPAAGATAAAAPAAKK